MKILITGAGGFLGARIVNSLLRAGQFDLRCQVREGRGVEKLRAVAAQAGDRALEIVACNLLSKHDTMELLEGVELVIHAAAGTRGTPADMMLNTVVATRNLLDAAVAAKVRRVAVVSSFAVYQTECLANGALLDETSPVEEVGIGKGPYALSKVRQEQLVLDYAKKFELDHVFVRPGVIYGDGGSAMSSRVGIRALGWFFSLGGSCLIPLTHADNCADAMVVAALNGAPGGIYNAVDSDLPKCSAYLRRYRREVEKLRTIPLPYFVLLAGSRYLAAYSKRSKGQLPAILTPYIVKSMYRRLDYSNAGLRNIGWKQGVSTEQGLTQLFEMLKAKN
jgi:nucleoside-diphosphate-sugar epimerase